MALLDGFGVAKEPALFGKMLKRAPFMFYVNPPRIGDEDLSYLVDSDVSTTASGFVAYGALKVLQLLRSQNFPDLDKLVRTQPSILLVDASEVSKRADFLVNLFLENMPSIIDVAEKNMGTDNVDELQEIYDNPDMKIKTIKAGVKIGSKFSKNKQPRASIATSQIVFTSNENIYDKKILSNPKIVSNLQAWEMNNINTNNDQLSSSSGSSGSYVDVNERSYKNDNHNVAHDMLGALLLTYPAVLSIDHQ